MFTPKVVFEEKFRNRKISLKKGLELIYNLEFTGYIRKDRFWWWRNFIDWVKYQKITYPSSGLIMVCRLNSTHKHQNTIRVVTTSNDDKSKLLVMKHLYGRNNDEKERKTNINS
jgi:hypothetical protein